MKKNKNIAVINVANINDVQIQATRKVLRGKATVKMSKKNLQKRAVERFQKDSKKSNLDILSANIPGQASLVFTNLDIFELKSIFERNKWMVAASPDAITPVDIWVPEGDTGLPTGQVISELNMTLKLPTRIQNDTIWIREPTRTHKAGELVTVKQASVLKKLGVTPIESIIKIHFAWRDGEIMPADVIYMDIQAFQQEFANAYVAALALATKIGVIDKETIKPLIQKGYREALALLFKMPIYDESMLEEYIRKAQLNAVMINALVLGEGLVAPQAQGSTPDKDDSKKKDGQKPSGIGGLFGGKDDEEEEEPTGIGGLF